jgi:hypothetical protein
MTPVRRQVGTDHGRIFQFIDEAISAGYPVVYLAPDAMEAMGAEIEREEMAVAAVFLFSVKVIPSRALPDGMALAVPHDNGALILPTIPDTL